MQVKAAFSTFLKDHLRFSYSWQLYKGRIFIWMYSSWTECSWQKKSFTFIPGICVSAFHNKKQDKAHYSGSSPNNSHLARKTSTFFFFLWFGEELFNSLIECNNFPYLNYCLNFLHIKSISSPLELSRVMVRWSFVYALINKPCLKFRVQSYL